MTAAAAVSVIATCILAEREALHRFLSQLKWIELRDGLVLLVMSVVLLPLMPNRPVDPWGALNPFQIWLVTILLAAISYGGYIAIRLAGTAKGALFAGLAGGLVSSTTVTWTFARMAKSQSQSHGPLTTGILSSWIVSLLRMTAIAAIIAPSMLLPLTRVTASTACVFAIVAFFMARIRRSQEATGPLKLDHPFELFAVIQFGALLGAIMLLSKWLEPIFGARGLYGLALTSGAIDVDPVTVSMAEVAGRSIPISQACWIIASAAAANLAMKCCLAIAFGELRFALPLLLTAGAGVAVGAALLP
jgi:uncharacterized membrane protein (DUF4010 family)